MNKKGWLLFLTGVVLMVFSVNTLFASGQKSVEETKEGPIEISFWSLFTGGDGEYFNAMVEEFNRTHDDIVMTTDTVKFDNYYTKLTTALTAQKAPDVVVVHRSNLLKYAPKGVLYPLNDALASMNAPLDDYVPAALEGCRFGDTLYALPLDVHALIMYYNNDLFKQAGVDAPVSLADFFQAAQAVQNKTGAMGVALDNTTATYKAYTLTRLFMSMLEQQGTHILTDDLKKANFNNPAGEAAVQALIDMVNKYKITPEGLDYDSSVAAFKLGEAAMHINGVWATGSFEQQTDLNFTAIPLPAFFGKPAAWSGSHTLAIPNKKDLDPRKVNAALEFMLWMSERGDLWAKAGHIPVRESVADNPDFKALPHRSDYAAAASSSFGAPRTAAWDEIYSNLSDALELAVATDMDANEALDRMEKIVNDILASY